MLEKNYVLSSALSHGFLMLTMFLFQRRLEQSPGLVFPHLIAILKTHLSLWGYFRVESFIIKAVWSSKRLERLCFFHSTEKQTPNTLPRCHNSGFLKLICCFFIALEISNKSNIKNSICSHTLCCIASIKPSHNIWWCCVWVWVRRGVPPIKQQGGREGHTERERNFHPPF